METLLGNLHFVLIAAGILLLGAFLLLSKYYYLERWVQISFCVLIGLSVLGAGISGCNQLKNDKGIDYLKTDNIEEVESSIDTSNLMSPKIKIIEQVNNAEIEIDQVISTKVAPKRQKINRIIDSLKQKRRSTFKHDSILLRIEALELMVAARKKYLKKDLADFEKNDIDSDVLELKINKYKEDVDSLINILTVNKL